MEGGQSVFMAKTNAASTSSFPLTFGLDITPWEKLVTKFREAIKTIASQNHTSYQESKNAVKQYFKRDAIDFDHPIAHDEDAKAVLDTVFHAEEELIRDDSSQEELYRRVGRHVREHLAGRLLEEHLAYLKEMLDQHQEGAIRLARRLGVLGRFEGPKALERFRRKISLYHENGSLVHAAELTLSTVKVKARSGARAQRGNLWPVDRREKYEFLETLADQGKVVPPFTEADMEFLVSQSSLEMLQKKTDLLIKELNFVEPNRLKANYSRLHDHLVRSKQRKSDFDRRRELLLKLGATVQQVDYISARATYQTMKNLLKLANGKLAISDLMGGKRTIRKLLRRRGKAQSRAEVQISHYLTKEEGIDHGVAEAYARTRKNHSLSHLKQTVQFLKENYERFYRNHWGFPIQKNVLRRALELGLSRQKLSKRALSAKDFVNDLRRSLALEEALVVKEQGNLTPDARRLALTPFKEVLDYETDTFTRKQLYFIYEQFCRYGLCIPKEKLKQICMQNSDLFPSPRKVQDALEILNGAYRAIGQHGEQLCVLPDYLRLPADKDKNSFYPNNP